MWDETTEQILNFSEATHPIFRSISPLERRELKSEDDKKTIHFNDSEQTIK